jgi:hypothetical protein
MEERCQSIKKGNDVRNETTYLQQIILKTKSERDDIEMEATMGCYATLC